MIELNINQVNNLILHKHHLTNDSKVDDIITITNDLCGLHGTGTIEPYLSLFVRMNKFNKEDLDRELYITNSIGRIRGMRKTLFIESKEMIPIVHNLIRTQTIQRDEKYLEYTGISKEDYDSISNQIMEILSQKQLSTTEIKKHLNSDKNIAAIISIMCDEMLLIRSKPVKSWKDRRVRYATFKSFFPDLDLNKFNESTTIKLLTSKYISNYGPVTIQDIYWWLGVTKKKVTDTLDDLMENIEFIKIQGLNHEYLIKKSDIDAFPKNLKENFQIVNVLPTLDPYMMGYKIRERYIDNKEYDYIYDRSGNATTSILFNGYAIGIWDIVEKPKPQIRLFIFNKVETQIKKKIELECIRIGKFITGVNLSIKYCKETNPLTKRTMGGFMSPLKECL